MEPLAPAWMLDAASLRAALDQIRVGLAVAPVAIGGAPHLHPEAASLFKSLRAVLEAVDAHDFDRNVVPTVAFPQAERALHHGLDDALHALHAAFERRTAGTFGAARLPVLRRLLATPVPDFLGVVGWADDENCHSDMLRWLLDPRCAPGVAEPALRGLVQRFDNAPAWTDAVEGACRADCVSVRREFVFGREWAGSGDLARIDLLVSGPRFTIAIENKVWSSEHSDQTRSYWDWLLRTPGLRGGVLLSPAGTSPASTDFLAVSYPEMLALLLDGPASGTASEMETLVLASYAKTLARAILREELRAVKGLEG